LTRIACSNSIQKKVTRWRKEHEDWEALAAFALSKTTGRRFKHKPHGESNSVFDIGSSEENAITETNASEKTAVNISNRKHDDEMLNCASVRHQKSPNRTPSDANKCPDSPEPKHVLNASYHNKQAAECSRIEPSNGLTSVSWSDAVVKQISLDELSDEELFLPPPDEETSNSVEAASLPASSTKIASGFFVVSDDEDSDAEYPATAAPAQTAASSSDTDDEHATSNSALRSSVKLSTMFARSLSHRQPRNAVKTAARDKKRKGSVRQNERQKAKEKKRSDSKRFSDKPFTKSRGSFPNVYGNRYPKKSEKNSHENDKVNTKYVQLA